MTAPPSNQTSTHALWVELTTRISSQRLHLKSGLEETAAESIFVLFRATRELMAKSVGDDDFLWIAESLLNDLLRPYTARWHGWMTHDKDARDANGKTVMKFRDAWVRRQFRRELQALQPQIAQYAAVLADLHNVPLTAAMKHALAPHKGMKNEACLGANLTAGIGTQIKMQRPKCRGGWSGWWRGHYRTDKSRRFARGVCKVLFGTTAEERQCCQIDEQNKRDDEMAARNPVAMIDAINKAEHEWLLERRRTLSRLVEPGATAQAAADGHAGADESANGPAAEDALVATDANTLLNATGIALSGGGIRSATFCLGIAQVLAKRKLLPHFDYLSTVSGGGYFGSFLSTYLGTGDRELPAASVAEEIAARYKETFDHIPSDTRGGDAHREPRALRHLRNRSRYLLDGAVWDKITNIGMVLAGAFFNLLMVLPIPIIGALLSKALNESKLLGDYDWIHNKHHWLPGVTAPWSWALWVALGTLALTVLLFPDVKRKALQLVRSEADDDQLQGWTIWFKWAIAASLLLLACWMIPMGFRLYHLLREVLQFGWVEKWTGGISMEKVLAGLGTLLTAITAAVASRRQQTGGSSGWIKKLALISGPALYLFVYFSVGYRMMFAHGGEYWSWQIVLAVTVVLLLWAWLLVDVNTYSPHGYYRDRLCECYLQSRKKSNKDVDPGRATVPCTRPRIRLQELGHCPAAPYHILNAALNLPSSQQLELRGRRSDFFVFSRHFCGSPIAGYFPTEEMEEADPHLDLGTAMAISGAAASSNMGWQTSDSLRLVMTLANVRLGYWMRNLALGKDEAKRLMRPGPSYLFREMFARGMDERQRYLNLSDGGHIENLAVYELLRRKCKFIVCVDGGQEPGMECVDLIRLERYAAIDLGITMHYDISDLMLQSNGFSRAYGVLVKIDYAPPANEADRDARPAAEAEWGWMLYLKLAMVGYGPGYVMDYKRENPCFPHQSTGDQLYDEAQFEAYRALGEAAAESFFTSEVIGEVPQNPATIGEWFQRLASNLLPDNDEAMKAG